MRQVLNSFVMSRAVVTAAVLVIAWLPGISPVWADEATTFRIAHFEVAGNTLLSSTEIDQAVAPYTGDSKNFGDIQRALEALEQTYHNHGYGSVQVMLPEQDITRGVVQFQVVEPRIGKVNIEGNKYFDAANVRASLPMLQEGAVPNSQAVARNLQLLDEHPTKHTTVIFRSGEADNETDAVIKIKDEKPLRYFATLDNTGTKETGNERLGIGFQHSNLFDRDQMLTVQYQTSPSQLDDVKIFGAGYHIPFYKLNSSLDLFTVYSDVDSGTLQGTFNNSFNVSGSGTVFGARYNFYLPRFSRYEQKLSLGVDYRAYKNDVELTTNPGATLVPDVTVHPTSVTYSGVWQLNQAQFEFYVSWVQNLFPGGSDGTDVDFKAARANARAGYRLWRAGATYVRALPKDWQLRAVFAGQQTSDDLVPGEQFGFGGPNSVRGFNLREVADDRGFSTNLEVYTPDFGAKLPWQETQLRGLVFYDMGTVTRNDPLPGEISGQTGASVGLGFRMAVGKHFNLRGDWAHVVDAAGLQAKDDDMIHFAALLMY